MYFNTSKHKADIENLSSKLKNQFGFPDEFLKSLTVTLFELGYGYDDNGLLHLFDSLIKDKRIPMFWSLDEWKLVSKKLYETNTIDEKTYDIAMDMTKNINDIVSMSCMQALEYVVFNRIVSDNFAIISIQEVETDGNGFEFTVSGNCKGVLNLRFSDVHPDMLKTDEGKTYINKQIELGKIVLFNDEHAKEIKRFVDNMNKRGDVKKLIIHCSAGVSRSPAVGAAISQYLFGNDGVFFKEQVPNRYVYDKLLNILKG